MHALPDPLIMSSGAGRSLDSVFQPYDRELREGETTIGGFIIPPFQRGSVWTREQEISLIESLIMGLPIHAFVLNQPTGDPDKHPLYDILLDGQQRFRPVYSVRRRSSQFIAPPPSAVGRSWTHRYG